MENSIDIKENLRQMKADYKTLDETQNVRSKKTNDFTKSNQEINQKY